MTITERKNAILVRIAEIQRGSDEEKEDMRSALQILGVNADA